VQIDIGFGDVVTPSPIETNFPTLLDGPAPKLFSYPRETVIAEKFEAMVKLGIANTRMKDFHDLRSLAALFSYESNVLTQAIQRTFERRKTPLPTSGPPLALTQETNCRRATGLSFGSWPARDLMPVSVEIDAVRVLRGGREGDTLLEMGHDLLEDGIKSLILDTAQLLQNPRVCEMQIEKIIQIGDGFEMGEQIPREFSGRPVAVF
jgi:Nucleotidyl transferase AbiEii toxin, Type IV TA system